MGVLLQDLILERRCCNNIVFVEGRDESLENYKHHTERSQERTSLYFCGQYIATWFHKEAGHQNTFMSVAYVHLINGAVEELSRLWWILF